MDSVMEADTDLKTKFYFRQDLCGLDEDADRYVRRIIRNADLNSEFGKVAVQLRDLTETQLKCAIPNLHGAGYDVMLAFLEQENPTIIGHMAFQQHDDDPQWRMFGLYVEESQRGRGYGTQLTRSFIQHAKDYGIRTVSLGAGNSAKMSAINRKIKEEETERKISMDLEKYVVTLCYKT